MQDIPEPRIRLACASCDTEEADGVYQIPDGWIDVGEVQSFEDSLKEAGPANPGIHCTDWFTHVGLCPACQKEGYF